MAAFILIMFVGESIEAIRRPTPPKDAPKNVKVNERKIIDSVNTGGDWHSADSTVATVKEGVVTGVKTGQTVITRTDNSGTTSYEVIVLPSTLHDAYLLSLMALLWVGFVLVWWRERIGAWLTIVALVGLVISVSVLNGIPLLHLVDFLAAAIPAIILLLLSYRKKPRQFARA